MQTAEAAQQNAIGEAAMLQGIPYGRIALIGYAIAALLAALAGVLMAPVTVVSPVIGTDYLMKTFIAVECSAILPKPKM